MKTEKLGKYIRQISTRNVDLYITDLRGINMNKEFIASVANTIGTDMSKYRVVKPRQFAFNPMHVGRDKLVPISMLSGKNPVIVSPAYTVFEITKPDELLPQYLMLWFRESDFDRRAWFTTDNSVRGGFSWESFCDLNVPVPDKKIQALICLRALFEKQEELVEKKLELIEAIDPTET
ncbi:hypothetical protein [Polaromonas sp. DSR2-3-2]|uniref:hypothetical protein n=1 Tax=unclassified Polaromonas TaxID=2638319 RepID=UPI003CFA1877